MANSVAEYESVFKVEQCRIISKLKVRVIQAIIQIERPVGLIIEQIATLTNELKRIKIYNSVANNKKEKTQKYVISLQTR